ncbi:UNVERIFIED_CONTAM: Retrovirus-related Pol polyprotein from transposon TNT 1-94 [Sesamum latifolium]|uniref:Retrovirus-related Pol polyprotein from transposon TNT 1-94 n=1 Tax=Sesamum latifolium TaxID=2727402 RepID=A0AAW2XSB0_9LAMI
MSLKVLRTDHGGEFTFREFNNICSEHGVHRQLTAAYSSQQNGVAERKNQTIMNLIRSMLPEKKVPKTFWSEAVKWVVHVLNRSPMLAVKDKMPEEAWSGLKPSVQHFRIFGFVAYIHIPDNSRTKLDEKKLEVCFTRNQQGIKGVQTL